METIPINSCTNVGYVQKPHGVNGELVIRFKEKYYQSFEKADTLFLEIDGLLVPYFFKQEDLRFRTGDSAIILLEWVDTEEKAKDLSGLQLYLREDQISASDNEIELDDLKGFLLIDQRKQQIGEILDVIDYSGNIVFVVKYLNNEIMVPFNKDFLLQLDEDKKVIALDIPDGLLQLDEE